MKRIFTIILFFIFCISTSAKPGGSAGVNDTPKPTNLSPGNQDASLNEVRGRLRAVNQVLKSYRSSTNARLNNLQVQIDRQDTLLDSFFMTADLSVVKDQQQADAAQRAKLEAKIDKQNKRINALKAELSTLSEGESNLLLLIAFGIAIALTLILFFKLRGKLSEKGNKITEEVEDSLEGFEKQSKKALNVLEKKSMEINQIAEDMVHRAKSTLEDELHLIKADLQKEIAELKKK